MPRLAATLASPDGDGALSAGPNASVATWRRAFAGLGPQVIGIIAALLVIRSFSADVDRLIAIRSTNELLAYVARAASGLPSTSIMAATMIVIIVAVANLGPRHGLARAVALAGAVLVASVLGLLARMAYGDWFVAPNWDDIRNFLAYVWPRYLLIGSLLTIAGELYRRERANVAQAQQAELDSVALERELAAAQLQALQAQIEPHFLFNTLANVRRLYDEDRTAGRTMLDMLMRYVEVALPGMRHAESTLEREAALIEAYLHIHRVRMGSRLAFAIDVPHELRPARVPSMMLLTLVENAVKHGLNPRADGGRIHVTARLDDARLVLTVADTGVGFGSGSGTGVGLANISARLASQFGDRAELLLANNELGGATAAIALPRAWAEAP